MLDDSPWLQPGAIEVMDKFLASRQNPWVFEWGAGGSTIWLAKHAQRVTSVEHNLEWFNRVADVLREKEMQNVEQILINEKSPYYSGVVHLGACLFLVDGIQRNECMISAMECLLVNLMPGILVVDNTERSEEYAAGLTLLKDWKRQDFVGDWTTSVFTRG